MELTNFLCIIFFVCFFFNDTATTEIYTLSLHDALPISTGRSGSIRGTWSRCSDASSCARSEEHTSELQSRFDLVCRLLLEKKKNHTIRQTCKPDKNLHNPYYTHNYAT